MSMPAGAVRNCGQMYEVEAERIAAQAKAIAYAREINSVLKRANESKAQLQQQFQSQMLRAKAGFDVVKDKMMKNIKERTMALQATQSELQIKNQQLMEARKYGTRN